MKTSSRRNSLADDNIKAWCWSCWSWCPCPLLKSCLGLPRCWWSCSNQACYSWCWNCWYCCWAAHPCWFPHLDFDCSRPAQKPHRASESFFSWFDSFVSLYVTVPFAIKLDGTHGVTNSVETLLPEMNNPTLPGITAREAAEPALCSRAVLKDRLAAFPLSSGRRINGGRTRRLTGRFSIHWGGARWRSSSGLAPITRFSRLD